ncbi:hypothetical protein CRENPOLYSF2_180005 [Crenothrix polyspora]|uniref:Uncharacterized protein n=1 Tax=Crenothrix polyspora TaxID=360316 RepID=A0A1R4H3W9_9GAMM|nr:hypothetical protein CRENPOLYSF2_180005 [Crenothrix polyspora]
MMASIFLIVIFLNLNLFFRPMVKYRVGLIQYIYSPKYLKRSRTKQLLSTTGCHKHINIMNQWQKRRPS